MVCSPRIFSTTSEIDQNNDAKMVTDESVLDEIDRPICPCARDVFGDNLRFPHLHRVYYRRDKLSSVDDVRDKTVARLRDLEHTPHPRIENHWERLSKWSVFFPLCKEFSLIFLLYNYIQT